MGDGAVRGEKAESFSRGWKGRLNKGGMREVINMKVVAKIQNTSVFPAGGTPGAALSQPGAVWVCPAGMTPLSTGMSGWPS